MKPVAEEELEDDFAAEEENKLVNEVRATYHLISSSSILKHSSGV
jgi:hypothetical protein